jgi:hypothetical protein
MPKCAFISAWLFLLRWSPQMGVALYAEDSCARRADETIYKYVCDLIELRVQAGATLNIFRVDLSCTFGPAPATSLHSVAQSIVDMITSQIVRFDVAACD